MLNTKNKKVINLSAMIGVTPEELSSISEEVSPGDEENWWGLAHELIRRLIPGQESWLDALKGQEITSINDVTECIKWHLNKDNINSER